MSTEALEARLNRLEATNRRLQRWVVTLSLFLAAFISLAAFQEPKLPDEIVCKKLTVSGLGGKTEIRESNISMQGLDTSLSMCCKLDDKYGTPIYLTSYLVGAELRVGGVVLNPEKPSEIGGYYGVALNVAPSGKCNVTLNDSEGNTRAVLGATRTVSKEDETETSFPESTLTLFGNDRKVIYQAPNR